MIEKWLIWFFTVSGMIVWLCWVISILRDKCIRMSPTTLLVISSIIAFLAILDGKV